MAEFDYSDYNLKTATADAAWARMDRGVLSARCNNVECVQNGRYAAERTLHFATTKSPPIVPQPNWLPKAPKPPRRSCWRLDTWQGFVLGVFLGALLEFVAVVLL